MIAKLVGYKRVDWQDKKDGRDRHMVVIYLARSPYVGIEDNVEGLVVEERSFFDRGISILPNPLVVGKEYQIVSERVGNMDVVVQFSAIDTK